MQQDFDGSNSSSLEDQLKNMGFSHDDGAASSYVSTHPAQQLEVVPSKHKLTSGKRNELKLGEDGTLQTSFGSKTITFRVPEGSLNSKPYEASEPMDPATFYEKVVSCKSLTLGPVKVNDGGSGVKTTSRRISWGGEQPQLSIVANVSTFGSAHLKKQKEKGPKGSNSRVVFYSNPVGPDALACVPLSVGICQQISDIIKGDSMYQGMELRGFCWQGNNGDSSKQNTFEVKEDTNEIEVSLDSIIATAVIFPADCKSAAAKKNQLFETAPYSTYVKRFDAEGKSTVTGIPMQKVFGKSGTIEMIGKISSLDLYEKGTTKVLKVTYVVDHLVINEAMYEGNNLATTQEGNSAASELEKVIKDSGASAEHIAKLLEVLKGQSAAQPLPQQRPTQVQAPRPNMNQSQQAQRTQATQGQSPQGYAQYPPYAQAPPGQMPQGYGQYPAYSQVPQGYGQYPPHAQAGQVSQGYGQYPQQGEQRDLTQSTTLLSQMQPVQPVSAMPGGYIPQRGYGPQSGEGQQGM